MKATSLEQRRAFPAEEYRLRLIKNLIAHCTASLVLLRREPGRIHVA